MRPSLRLGSYAGINIGLHWSVGVILVLLTLTLSGTILPTYAAGYAGISYLLAAVAAAGLFMASIIAHELGHSVVAERNGVKVRGITLFALGGVAALESEPQTPGVAARIAAAGPAVSVAIGLGSLGAAWLAGAIGLSTLTVVGLGWLGVVNLALAVFNMIPALPLDGGRVLQAGLWWRLGDRHTATIRSATIGRYIGWAIITFGFWQVLQGASGLWTMLIGFFIVSTARGEELRARMARRLESEAGTGTLFDLFRPPTGPASGQDPRAGRPSDFGEDVIDVNGHPVDDPTEKTPRF